jgi:uncharacterized membrane protein
VTQLENERLARVEEKVNAILEKLDGMSTDKKTTESDVVNLKTRIAVLEIQLKIAWGFILIFLVNLVFPLIRSILGV